MTAKFNLAMELSNCDKREESFTTRGNKIQLSWQLKALLAGRIPLPTSRPKRKVHEIENPESGEDSSISREDEKSAASSDSPHSGNEKESTIAVHVAKRPKLNNLKVARKQWKLEEIHRVVSMRKNKMAWENILEHFPDRTIVGVRQIFWKYSSSYGIYQA